MAAHPDPGDLVPIEEAECWRLLSDAAWIRVGLLVEGEPAVLPVNALVHDGGVYFRTGAGSKLGSAADEQAIAVEADGGDVADRTGWSVLARGRASIVTEPRLVEELMAQPFEPWALPDGRLFWIEVRVTSITGRRIART